MASDGFYYYWKKNHFCTLDILKYSINTNTSGIKKKTYKFQLNIFAISYIFTPESPQRSGRSSVVSLGCQSVYLSCQNAGCEAFVRIYSGGCKTSERSLIRVNNSAKHIGHSGLTLAGIALARD